MSTQKVALITGVTGQDGAHLARLLLSKGYVVHGIKRRSSSFNTARVDELYVDPHEGDSRFFMHYGDMTDATALIRLIHQVKPDEIYNLAAQSHVQVSFETPEYTANADAIGTLRLLEAIRILGLEKSTRFYQASTSELYGKVQEVPQRETTPFYPRSPYAASKAAADHLARAWHHTYGLPVIVTNCTNNYGPRQHPEKLIPLMIIKASAGLPLPVYGRGDNVRDWLHVEDHARGLALAARRGVAGETYCFGGDAERSNLALVERLCDLLDDRLQRLPDGARRGLIRFVADRPGHDRRYAMDVSETTRSLGWRPARELETGLAATVDWYLRHEDWWRPVVESGATDRLGLPAGTRLAG